ncbi:MAG: VWA domain-containing protein [Muribaculaceae bacterium]|nr:VWA domain-containing protein [Muribaculaceae bacterium]
MKIFNFFKMCAQPIEGSDDSKAITQPENTKINQTADSNPTGNDNMKDDDKVKVHNLIILDESGSMMSIYYPALSGVNETLQTIRGAQKEHPDQEHFVTLVTFDTSHYNKIYHNTPADKAIDITGEQYRPCGGTPLYDAMGRSINELRTIVKKGDVVLVTVITDGYENASQEYNGKAIKSLVEEMRKAGWVFTYIGANQDVEAVADAMSINNRMAFAASAAGTKAMFEKERMSRKRFFSKISKDSISPDLEKGYFDSEDEFPPY